MGFRIGVLKNNTLNTIFAYHPQNIVQLSKLLKDHYTKLSDIEELISLGDIHSLKETVDSTVFYHRDKDDPFNLCAPCVEDCSTLDEVDVYRSPVDYYLVWTNKWNICEVNSENWTSVTKFLNKVNRTF